MPRADQVKLTEDAIGELARLLQVLKTQLHSTSNIRVIYRNIIEACDLVESTMAEKMTQPKNPLTVEEERWYQAVIQKRLSKENTGPTAEFMEVFVRRNVALGYFSLLPDGNMLWGPRIRKFGNETVPPSPEPTKPESKDNVVKFPNGGDPTDAA